MTLYLETDRALIRASASSKRHLLVRVTAPRAPEREERIPVNVGLVLDRSGSMSSERKFGLARDAVEQSLRMLRSDDRFALVVYDTEINVLMPSTLATPAAKEQAMSMLHEVGPRGGTDLGAGWLRGCEQVAEFLVEERVSRCLLLTDGLANHGMTDRGELARHAAELRRRGVSTSTFGVGADFDERLLRDMAHEGGGNFYFIEGAEQILALLTGELGEALEVTLRNASLLVVPPRGGSVQCLNRYRSHLIRERDELRIELGDLVSSQELDVVIEARFDVSDVGETEEVRASLMADRQAPVADGVQTWTYADHRENDLQPRNRTVDRAVAALYAARARAEATEANREGRYDRARRIMEDTASRIRSYAGDDRELQQLARALREEVHEYAEAPMTAVAMKMSVYSSEVASKGRQRSGRARRST
jgi:Ca-activated chloride channel homolog